MKRVFLAVICIFMLCLSSCSLQPSIRPAELTKGEKALLRMFDQNYPQRVFDFTAPQGAVGLIVRRQHLQDGQWVAAEHYLHVTEKNGRIAISFDSLADGLHCAILQKGDVESTSAIRREKTETDAMMIATTVISSTVSAELNQEIPLLMQVFSAADGMPFSGGGLSSYPDSAAFAGYDEVYIVTAAFTDKPLE